MLDGFRFIAILFVMLYHFAYSWKAHDPYGKFFLHIFHYGYLGVQFFFMISGFVISYTLENTPNLLSFYKNRFSRLFPPMLLCSLTTLMVVYALDNDNLFRGAKEVKNLVPSLTFINPNLWTLATKINFQWLNGSYWSLWVEVQFYIISSAVYFLNKKYFFRNTLLTGIAISGTKCIPNYLNNHIGYLRLGHWYAFFNGWRYGDELFNITFFMPWFLIGVIFYQLYKGFNIRRNIFTSIFSMVAFMCLLYDTSTFFPDSFYETMLACFLMLTFFTLMIYKRNYLVFLESGFLTRVGMISYSIYLIHEVIGDLLIHKYEKYLGDWKVLSPVIIMVMVTGFAELSYRFYERRASLLLKRMLTFKPHSGNKKN